MPKIPPDDLQIDWKDHPYSADFLQSTLDRIIGFVNSCDIKSSIVLGIFGIVLSGLLSKDILVSLYNVLSFAYKSMSFLSVLYMLIFIFSSLSIICGLYYLISAISAKISPSKKDSKIYFVDIAMNLDETKYKEKLKPLRESALVDDLISQVYINSKICTRKYRRYNLGLKFLSIGILVFLFSNLVAHNLYILL